MVYLVKAWSSEYFLYLLVYTLDVCLSALLALDCKTVLLRERFMKFA